MRSLTKTLLLALLASGFVDAATADTNSQAAVAATVKGAYKELPEDLKLIRKTYSVHNSDGTISRYFAGEAVAAAGRVFKNIDFVGMKREVVLTLLATDYGVIVKRGKDDPLVYRFDTGFGGWQFTLHFKDDVVTKIQAESLD